MAETRYLYFAYGSNLYWPRMRERCPGARLWGPAILKGYRLVESLYADIRRSPKGQVWGVLYTVTPEDLANLDRHEGLHNGVYARVNVPVDYGQRRFTACTYVMTEKTHQERRKRPYPVWYRNICSIGAQWHGIPDGFKLPAATPRPPEWSFSFPSASRQSAMEDNDND